MELKLDFALLDDVLPVAAASDSAAIRTARPQSLGALVEYAYQARANPSGVPPLADLSDAIPVRELRRTLGRGEFNRMAVSASHQALDVEFHWVPPRADDFSAPAWIMFLRRLQNAAERAGFSRRVAAGITGAFGEMADNAFRHSFQPATAIAAYAWSDGCFEYVVADAGQGVLASLRSCPDYGHLTDAGDALHTALTEGESRLGRGVGHGRGFREVFISLSNLSGSLRFRSGDHVLTIDGASPDLSRVRLAQLGLDFAGLLVSTVCRPR